MQLSTSMPIDGHAPGMAGGPPQRTALWRDVLLTLGILCRDPLGGVRAAERRVGDEAAGGVGMVFGALADLGLVTGMTLLLGGVPLALFVQLLLCGLAPLGGSLLIVSAARNLTGRRGRLRLDLYVVGTSALPIGVAVAGVGLLGRTHGAADAVTLIAATVLAVLLLYSGCRYVLRLSTLASAVAVPLVVAAVAVVSAGLVGPFALMLAKSWLTGSAG